MNLISSISSFINKIPLAVPTSTVPIVKNQYLELYYDPSNPAGSSNTTLIDLSGKGNNGILPTSTTISGSKILLNNNYVATTYYPNLDNLTPYTFELWFRDNSPGITLSGSSTALVSNYGLTTTTPTAQLAITSTGYIGFTERNASSVTNGYTLTTNNICNNAWNHIVKTSTDTQQLLYLNGVNISAATTNRPGGVITSTSPIVIGGGSLNRCMTCSLGAVRIYKGYALTGADVLTNYNAEYPIFSIL